MSSSVFTREASPGQRQRHRALRFIRQLIEELISEIQIYEERQPNGQWLKSIKFKLPIIAEDMSLSLDNDAHIETVVRLKQNK